MAMRTTATFISRRLSRGLRNFCEEGKTSKYLHRMAESGERREKLNNRYRREEARKALKEVEKLRAEIKYIKRGFRVRDILRFCGAKVTAAGLAYCGGYVILSTPGYLMNLAIGEEK